MVTTSPDNLWSPDLGTNFVPTTDLAMMQSTVQAALTSIPKNYLVGTNTQRLAVTNLFNGLEFYCTDTKIAWRYDAGWKWLPRNVARLELSANQSITATRVQINGLSQVVVLPSAGRVRLTLSVGSYSGGVSDAIQFSFRDGTTTLVEMVDSANSSPSIAATSRNRSFNYDWDAAAGSHTINAAAAMVVGASGTIASSATSRTTLSIDWLG